MRIRLIIAGLSALSFFALFLGVPSAQTNSLYNFIFGAPTATLLVSTDYIPVTQGGVIKHIPGTVISFSMATNIMTHMGGI